MTDTPIVTLAGARDGGDRTYPPSWVNVLTVWMERLPGPTWLAYIVGAMLGLGLSAVVGAEEPTLQRAGAGPAAYYALLPFAVIGMVHLLDRSASRAISSLRPRLSLDDAQVAQVRYELTVVPARPALVIAGLALVVGPPAYAADPDGSGIVGLSLTALAFRWLWEALVSAVFLILIYHTFRQLRWIERIHEAIAGVDIFDQAPLYAMSRVTSGTATGLLVLLAPSAFLVPSGANSTTLAITGAWYLFAVGVAGAFFILPLRGMHGVLAAEKRRRQGEIGRRLTANMEALHASVDAADGVAIEVRTKALAALLAERDVVNRVPTWPWSTGALTGFLSAVLLSIGLWLATRVLERFV